MLKQFLLLLFIISSTVFYSYSQKYDIYEITGRVINEKTGEAVRYATIINLKKSKATACDSLGYFNITVLKDDIIKIYALGFEKQYISISEKEINPSEIIIIKLTEKTYEIGNVDVFEERWKDFIFEFTHSEIKQDETKKRIKDWFYTLVDPKELAVLTAAAAVGIPINYKTKADRQKLKVEELKKTAAENALIEAKYNPDLVSELTGFNKIETIKFMRFCNFSRNFLLKASDYDIITSVKDKFDRYIKMQIR